MSYNFSLNQNLFSLSKWVRGATIGHGSFATISIATPRKSSADIPSLMAVKSSQVSCADSLKNEKRVLDTIGSFPQIVRCFGEEQSVENGEEFHNLFMEFASGGSLANRIKSQGGRLSELEIRRHARSILKGLSFIHAKGFVHCDIKPQNILVFDDGAVKIADFGLAKEAKMEQNQYMIRGTPLYVSPESVNDNEYESPCDIWALGCVVAEMATGKPVRDHEEGASVWPLLLRIGGEEEPEIPSEISEEGKDFLRKCFVKDPRKRWTAEMLLIHAFVLSDYDNGDDANDTVLLNGENCVSCSPRCPFDFPEWVSTSEPEILPESACFPSPADKIRELVTEERPNWSFADSWVTVRNYNNCC
ncbi:Mitogen-activated protein kinase kinase kinase A [Morus notabilis]|uniref:Mitogen-activated protein kinase kinase kinase A n=1 Tax=Morus notabilis TaxID=981085 RepID=W9R4J6_9ROSA|nr:mitogen-activated protein kinase kinase kinase 17 [Morus notabilis]EXB54389.1 Mitogen-activated protein kinase kinase kinase A [Morus notabilis]